MSAAGVLSGAPRGRHVPIAVRVTDSKGALTAELVNLAVNPALPPISDRGHAAHRHLPISRPPP